MTWLTGYLSPEGTEMGSAASWQLTVYMMWRLLRPSGGFIIEARDKFQLEESILALFLYDNIYEVLLWCRSETYLCLGKVIQG